MGRNTKPHAGPWAWVGVWLCASAAAGQEPLAAEDEAAAYLRERARLVWHTPADEVYAGETLRVELELRLEAEFFARKLIAGTARALEVPVQVDAPDFGVWAGSSPARVSWSPGGEAPRLALGGRAVGARRLEPVEDDAGLRWYRWRVGSDVWIAEPGELILPAATLSATFAREFRDDLLFGRQPLERLEGKVIAEPRTLRVLALPQEGRPEGFGGAVGRFELVARLAPGPGELPRLVLQVRGRGNFGGFAAPEPKASAGWRPLGRLERELPDGIEWEWDWEPLAADWVTLPPLALVHFDPSPPGRYRVAYSNPVDLPVEAVQRAYERRLLEQQAALSAAEEAGGEFAVPGGEPVHTPKAGLPWPVGLGVLALGMLLGALWTRWSAARRDRRTPRPEAPLPRDLSQIRAPRRAGGAADLALERLAAHLAARLGEDPEALGPKRLADRLAKLGIDRDLAVRVTAALEQNLQARYAPPTRRSAPPVADPQVADLESLLAELISAP